MLEGSDDGMTHPKNANTITIGLRSYFCPSEISNSMRGVVTARGEATRGDMREPAKDDRAAI